MAKKIIDFPRKLDQINPSLIKKIIRIAYLEDLGNKGDITSQAVLRKNFLEVNAHIIAKESGIICGMDILIAVYRYIDPKLRLKSFKKDGERVNSGDIIIEMAGNSSSILRGERIALNFLGMMSGVATKTNRLVKLLEGSNTKLLDTRKTLPGLREFQKFAVYKGGGYNHRIGLYDMILIKENHVAAAGGITRAVELAREKYPDVVVEIEISGIDQISEVLATQADIVMLDNMNNEQVKMAFDMLKNDKYVEVSGNIDETRLIELAKIGVDFVSMGALTHTIKPLDISLLIK